MRCVRDSVSRIPQFSAKERHGQNGRKLSGKDRIAALNQLHIARPISISDIRLASNNHQGDTHLDYCGRITGNSVAVDAGVKLIIPGGKIY